MTKLNVIDLDDTLLPYDSLNEYIKCFLRKPRQFLPLASIITIRKMRLIDKALFLRLIMKICRKATKYDSIMQSLARQCCQNICKEVLEIVGSFTDASTKLVLCTASPADYTKHIAGHLGWELLASELSKGDFIHMHGAMKIKQVNAQYPRSRYQYHFAISDSTQDYELLKQFNNYLLYSRTYSPGVRPFPPGAS
jgi:phosphoserine phosphatase